MKRDPSIHITKSKLLEIYKEMGHGDYVSTSMVNEIFMRAKAFSIHTRTISVSTEWMEKKAQKLIQSTRREADLFAQIIYSIRLNLKHRGISLIKPSDKEWPMLKEVTAHALNFFNEFEFETKRAAFIKYATIGINKMKKFNLNKFLRMYEPICEAYIAMKEIEMDDDKEMTKEAYNIYSRYIIGHTGIHDKMELIPEKYVWFVRMRKQAKEINVSVKLYIDSQFEVLNLDGGIPHPALFVGPKATDRIISYMYKQGIKIDG